MESGSLEPSFRTFAHVFSKVTYFRTQPDLSVAARELAHCGLQIASHGLQSPENSSLDGSYHISESHRAVGLAELSSGVEQSKSTRSQFLRSILMQPANARHWIALSMELGSNLDDATSLGLSASTAECAMAVDESPETVGWSSLLSGNATLESSRLESTPVPNSLVESIDSVAASANGVLQTAGFQLLGRLLYHLGEIDSAVQILKKAVSLTCESSTNVWLLPLYYLADIYIQIQRPLAAQFCYQQAIKMSPTSSAHTLHALLLYKCGDVDAAMEIMLESLKIGVDTVANRFLQTLLLLQSDRKKHNSRIKKNLAVLQDCIGDTAMRWLESQ